MFALEAHENSNVQTSTGSSSPSRTADALQGIAAEGDAGSSGNAQHLNVFSSGRNVHESTNSLGSSPSGGSTAENWFDSCNSNVQKIHRAEFIDNDPPYYVGREHRCGPPPPHYASNGAPPGKRVIAGDDTVDGGTSSLFTRDRSRDSSEEFRSVIDDLTIENKELKRRLQRLESLHCLHLEDDKLFEIKMHGLPLNKKRELEGLLRGFAADLKQSLDEKVPSDDPFPTSDTQLGDSAYASSGRTSATALLPRSRSKHPTSEKSRGQRLLMNVSGTTERIHARHAPLASERAKMKPIVRRLEQLFTGCKAAGAEREQPTRQQLVSEPAVCTANGLGQTSEGLREACIYPAGAGAPIGPMMKYQDNFWSPAALRSENPETSQSPGPSDMLRVDRVQEQRPTRPLDLDPNRAQCPAANIDYIRHLGVCSPNQNLDTPSQHDEGWVYLNVLTNMAQLHTTNVTPEFVRKAITNLSDKLELSADGRKIRWKGGGEGTNMISDSGGTSGGERGSSDPSDDGPGAGGAKRRKLGHGLYKRKTSGGSQLESEHLQELISKKRRKPHVVLARSAGPGQQFPLKDGDFHYKPLFFHWEAPSEDGGYTNTDNSNPPHSPQVASASSSQYAQQGGNFRPPRCRREGGPIIFFNGADFCTDLSGDGSDFSSNYSSLLSAGYNAYTRYEKDVLGCLPRLVASGSADFSRPLTESHLADSGEEVSDAGSDRALAENIAALSNFKISPQRFASDGDQAIPHIELEASGVGGIQPSDNFTINVSFTVTENKLSYLEANSSTSSSRAYNVISRILETPTNMFKSGSPKAYPGLAKNNFNPPVKCNIISVTRVDLPPFQVPPPTYFFQASSSSECYSSDSMESGALTTKSSSQSSFNQRSFPTEATRDCVIGGVPEVSSSMNFIPLRHIRDADAVARPLNKLKSNFRNEIRVGILADTDEGGGGSGYESEDGDMP